jgi:Cu/Ag efflux protein CusF
VNLRRPGDPGPATAPMTTTQRKDRTPGSETRRQQTVAGTVEAIDAKAPSVTVKGPQGRVVALAVRDATLLQNVKLGDTVDVTYYESLLIKVARPPD